MTGSHPTLTTLIIESLLLKGWEGVVFEEEGGKKRVLLAKSDVILDSGQHDREYDAWAHVHMQTQNRAQE